MPTPRVVFKIPVVVGIIIEREMGYLTNGG